MNEKPKYLVLYKCTECNLDSSFTETDEASCRYCDSKTEMQLVSKQEITPELMEQRIRELSDNMFTNLQSAYNNMTAEDKSNFPEGQDAEKEMLLLLSRVKKLRDSLRDIDFGKADGQLPDENTSN